MRLLQLKNKWVLVTGASSGLGREIATQLARNFGANIIIVARRTEQLLSLQKELESQYKISVKVCTADLSQKDKIIEVFDFAIKEQEISAVVLNAGITYFGKDRLISDTHLESIIQTNITAMAILMQRFAKYFNERSLASGMLVVSSMAAISPAPYQALYSGTKSFIYGYAQALSAESENKDFTISIFAPGGIRTEMTAQGAFDSLQKWLMPVDKVAKIALAGFVKRKLLIIPGLSNRLGSQLFHFLPKGFLLSQLGKVYAKALTKTEKTD